MMEMRFQKLVTNVMAIEFIPNLYVKLKILNKAIIFRKMHGKINMKTTITLHNGAGPGFFWISGLAKVKHRVLYIKVSAKLPHLTI